MRFTIKVIEPGHKISFDSGEVELVALLHKTAISCMFLSRSEDFPYMTKYIPTPQLKELYTRVHKPKCNSSRYSYSFIDRQVINSNSIIRIF